MAQPLASVSRIAVAFFTAGTAQAADLHVTPGGHSFGSGSVDQPYDLVTALSGSVGKPGDTFWLHEGFVYAKQVHALGVMVIQQADLNFNNEQHLTDTRSWDAFPDYVKALTNETLGFNGQVALVHGDSHYFKLDKPLNGPGGGVLANFTRVETFGARNTHWVSATIDPDDPNLFEFEARIVPANAN